MKSNATKIIAGVAAVAGAYFLYKYFKKPGVKKDDKKSDEQKPKDVTPAPADSNFPLKKGSKGRLVSAVQQWLLKIDKNSLPKFGADGKFGAETEDALQKYLGKKTVDSDADINKLMFVYQQKTFPLMFPKPAEQPFPSFPRPGFPK